MCRYRRAVLKVIIDVIISLILASVILVYYGEDFSPYQRGLFCHDLSIRYPNKVETVNNIVLYISSVAIGVLAIACSEFTFKSAAESFSVEDGYSLCGRIVPRGLQVSYIAGGTFVLGMMFTEITTTIMKLMVGRLRPNFWDVCRPDLDCTAQPPGHYFEDIVCTGHPRAVLEARRSFPSGHSSNISYAMIFSIMYMCMRLRCTFSAVLLPALCLGCLLLACFISLSRISDHKHHASDVIAGSLLGVVTAFISICFLRFHLKDNELHSSKGDWNGMLEVEQN